MCFEPWFIYNQNTNRSNKCLNFMEHWHKYWLFKQQISLPQTLCHLCSLLYKDLIIRGIISTTDYFLGEARFVKLETNANVFESISCTQRRIGMNFMFRGSYWRDGQNWNYNNIFMKKTSTKLLTKTVGMKNYFLWRIGKVKHND
jgi:hypothetical protein